MTHPKTQPAPPLAELAAILAIGTPHWRIQNALAKPFRPGGVAWFHLWITTMPNFKPEAKTYRVQIDMLVVAMDGQGAAETARAAWADGATVGEKITAAPEWEPRAWMAYDDFAVEK
mgnify:CR=1 FL=1